ncbi:MAG: phosphoribosylaminoimidazolesuccinocarboxamide synthase [Deltaproteobacteria bacterium]|nr:MAG: phosphoribosylaminoimidazolesuccinocarboxamide synthase [Deltaproteobacteria bacterium]
MGQELLTGLPLLKQGKVRDIYDLGDHLLMVASDRISCFDVVLPTRIPDKGKILTALSAYWFHVMSDLCRHHLVTTEVGHFPDACRPYRDKLEGRSMLVKKTAPAPVECVVRGYLFGSAWKEYRESGRVCGIPLSKGLVEASRLEKPIFTPSTKAPVGEHDENITFDEMVERVGRKQAEQMREISIAIYLRARKMAEARGIIIADTKFEFGLATQGILLIDELLTPDSSRFWLAEGYQAGKAPESFDKQYVRDYLLGLHWDTRPPVPSLPPEVVHKTQEKYVEALRRLKNNSTHL